MKISEFSHLYSSLSAQVPRALRFSFLWKMLRRQFDFKLNFFLQNEIVDISEDTKPLNSFSDKLMQLWWSQGIPQHKPVFGRQREKNLCNAMLDHVDTQGSEENCRYSMASKHHQVEIERVIPRSKWATLLSQLNSSHS